MMRFSVLVAALAGFGCGTSNEGGRSGTNPGTGGTMATGGSGGVVSTGSGGSSGTLGAGGARGGVGGSATGGTGGAPSTLTIADVDNLELVWITGPDAGASVEDVVLRPDGTAACSHTRSDGVKVEGKIAGSDPQFRAVLERPGVVADLSTPCPLRIADAGDTITTSFLGGKPKISRLVFGSCSNDNLAALVAAMRRIGAGCIDLATATSM